MGQTMDIRRILFVLKAGYGCSAGLRNALGGRDFRTSRSSLRQSCWTLAIRCRTSPQPTSQVLSCMQFLDLPAPQLEYFSMRATTGVVTRSPFKLPFALFAKCTPALRHLTLEGGLDFSWDCPIFRKLITLKVQPLRLPRHGIRRLLQLAAESPNLTALTLSQDADVVSVRAHMQSLDRSELELFDSVESCHRLLSFIDAPALTFLEISHRGPCVSDVEAQLPRTFAFHSRTQESNFVKVVASEGRGNTRNGIRISLAIVPNFHKISDASLIGLYRQHRIFQCQLFYYASGSPRSTPALTMGLLRHLCPSLENVKVFLVRSLEHFRRSLPFHDMLGYLPAIECLEVVYDSDNVNQEFWQLFKYFGAVARSGPNSLALTSIIKLVIDLPALPYAAARDLTAFLEHRAAQGQRLSYLGIPNLMDVEDSLSTLSQLTSLVECLARILAHNKCDQLESTWTNIGGFRIL